MSNLSENPSEVHAAASQTPRISLNLSSNSHSISKTQKITLPKTLKRPHTTALHDENDDEEDDGASGKAQRVSHFDRGASGSINTARPPPEPEALVIPQPKNSGDWRTAANRRKRQKNGHPHRDERPGGREDPEVFEREMEEKKPAFGLTIRPPRPTGGKERDRDEGRDAETGDEGEERRGNGAGGEAREKTEDERAIDALLGRDSTDHTLVVPQAMSVTEALRHDVDEAPEASTLDDYARIPVDQFGAAMLRGMGWKDTDEAAPGRGGKTGKNAGQHKTRRAPLLGIGAKEEAAITAEMGAWGRKGKEIQIYNPLMLKDKQTGETYTEDELQKKKEHDERERWEAEFERKERARAREQGRGENGHRRREDRERDRRRRDDGSGEERHPRKERERNTWRERDDRNGDYDRERSRRHRERDDKDDEYDRERSRRHRERDERERHRDHDRHRERERRRQ